MSKKPTCIPFDFTIKLADFGYSYTYLRASIDEDGGGIKDSCGGQTYGKLASNFAIATLSRCLKRYHQGIQESINL